MQGHRVHQFALDVFGEMQREVLRIILVLAGGLLVVQGQSLAITEIHRFQVTNLNNLHLPFNSLRDDVYGHFYRSQSSLRRAREAIFTRALKFPYYRLTNETRDQLVKRVTVLMLDVIDPTVDYLQKDSMLRYYNFMNESSPIEKALDPMKAQLEELIATVSESNNTKCVDAERINSRKLEPEFTSLVTAINTCIREATAAYRQPINEFTRVHFIALPLIGRIRNALGACEEGNNQEECVKMFLKKYCDSEECKIDSTINIVKTQAEIMVNKTQDRFDECLASTLVKAPSSLSLNQILREKCFKRDAFEDSNVETVEDSKVKETVF